jgi:hypothetical protein
MELPKGRSQRTALFYNYYKNHYSGKKQASRFGLAFT